MLTPEQAISELTEQQRQLFQKIFLNDLPMMDLRAPSEFAQGAFPNTTNIPLMNDQQRAQVGTVYKKQGQDAAIQLGHQLVSGAHKDALIQRWSEFCAQNPEGALYCFRGGLRSKTVANWLTEAGVDYPRIEGGYKALRQYLIGTTAELVAQNNLWIIGGRTGCAKTDFVNAWQQGIDLEGLANHRGSSFGRRSTPQPTVISFENAIAIELLKKSQLGKHIVLEDEGVTIGSCSLPLVLREAMKKAPILLLELPFEQRVETILNDYIIGLSEEYIALDGALGYDRYQQAMLDALERIKKRLGGVLFDQLSGDLSLALKTRDLDDHRTWIDKLLRKYYDPMYNYQIEKKQDRVVYQGDAKSLKQYLLAKGLL